MICGCFYICVIWSNRLQITIIKNESRNILRKQRSCRLLKIIIWLNSAKISLYIIINNDLKFTLNKSAWILIIVGNLIWRINITKNDLFVLFCLEHCPLFCLQTAKLLYDVLSLDYSVWQTILRLYLLPVCIPIYLLRCTNRLNVPSPSKCST